MVVPRTRDGAVVLLAPSVPRLLPPGTLRLERGLANARAGASLTGGALAWAVGSWDQGRPGLRFARTQLVTVGLLLVAATVFPAFPVWMAAVGWAVTGLGMGLGAISLGTTCAALHQAAARDSTAFLLIFLATAVAALSGSLAGPRSRALATRLSQPVHHFTEGKTR